MHLVRRAFLRSEPSTATVTQIVTDHGFWELGRFSAYRALFGESPSQTLRQSTWQCSRGLSIPQSSEATPASDVSNLPALPTASTI
jgi:hypothetical protein